MMEKPASAPEITEEMVVKVNRFLEGCDKKDSIFNYTEDKWLDDKNIDTYFDLIKQRNAENGKYPTVYAFGCYFFKMLYDSRMGHKTVKEATGSVNIFDFDLIFVPCLISLHWRLAVLDTRAKTLLLYDSRTHADNRTNELCLKKVAYFLKKEYHKLRTDAHPLPEGLSEAELEKTKARINKLTKDETIAYFQASEWTVKCVKTQDIPRQTNSSDCGVFILQYAEYLARRTTFDFNKSHMPYFRKRMTYESLDRNLTVA